MQDFLFGGQKKKKKKGGKEGIQKKIIKNE